MARRILRHQQVPTPAGNTTSYYIKRGAKLRVNFDTKTAEVRPPKSRGLLDHDKDRPLTASASCTG